MKQADVNPETLNTALREMILNAKSGADLMNSAMKSDRDALLDACRVVLGKATAFVTSATEAQKKLDLVGAVITFVEVLNRIETQIGSS